MLPSTESLLETKRDSLQCVVEKAEKLEELVKLFSYIDISTTKAFLTSAIDELSMTNINYAYFGVRNIEEILCKELLTHIFSFLYVFERFKYCTLSQTFYSILYTPPSSNDITHYETWISFDINIDSCQMSDMLFLYEKQYPTYLKLNPLKLPFIHYLLHKLHLNFTNLKIGAQGFSLLHKIIEKIKYDKHNQSIPYKLKEWISSLESIAFVANDVNTINQFLHTYKPKLLYLSIDSIRYNTVTYPMLFYNHSNTTDNGNNVSYNNLLYADEYLQEGYDAPQPTPTPAAQTQTQTQLHMSTQKDPSSSSSFIPSPNNNGNANLSSDYSASEEEDMGGIHSFYAIHESSDGYHCEGHMHRSTSSNRGNVRVFRNSHSSNAHNGNGNKYKERYHRYKDKHHSRNKSQSQSHNNGRNKNIKIPISFKYQHNIHNIIYDNCKNGLNNNNNIIYEKVRALQIFSSYSEIRIGSIAYLMKFVHYLGIDINVQKLSEIQKLQQIIYCKHLSPHLNHLSITDFKDLICIPNRVNSLVIQRWFTNLSHLQFESQFFPYNLSVDIHKNEYFLGLNELNKRLHTHNTNKSKDVLNNNNNSNTSASNASLSETDTETEMKSIIECDIISQINLNLDFECDQPMFESSNEDLFKPKDLQSQKRIYLNTHRILPNTTSKLFEIKLLLNFDTVRNRWIILAEQFEFLNRLKCIESLSVIHFVMLHQSVLNKHANQYYYNSHRHRMNGYRLSLSPTNSINNGNIHDLRLTNNYQNILKNTIYDFPRFDCEWHKNKPFYVIAPKECCNNAMFKSAFPSQTQFYSFNPMIRNKYYNDEQWEIKKKLMQISDLFAVGLPNQLQYPL